MRALNQLLDGLSRMGAWLAVPLVLLLFVQWPLRDLVKGFSREANDLGQIIFALYVAIAVTAATRAGRHLHSDALAHRFSPRLRRGLEVAGVLLALLPWAAFVAFASWPLVRISVAQLEKFADTSNPGYFLIKVSAALMALLVVLQGILSLRRRG